MKYISRIYLNSSHVSKEEWQKLITAISKYNGFFRSWKIVIEIDQNKINYYLVTNFKVPTNILNSYLIENIDNFTIPEYCLTSPTFLPLESNIIDIINYSKIKKLGDLKYISIRLFRISDEKILSKTHIYCNYKNQLIRSKLLLSLPCNILSVDFKKNNIYSYKKTPKYLDISKILHTLKTDTINSTLKVDTFPYLDGSFYLDNNNIDFAKHSLIIGASGSGKSKYISSFIKTINDTYKDNYKIVMIDPHASIINDIGALAQTINFQSIEESLDLFSSNSTDYIANTELTLDLFKTLISDQYNSKLERVLRHSIYLLLSTHNFNFINLKKIILDSVYRTSLINDSKSIITESVINFFLNDFNDLKTKSYGEAISPIISFIDEMEMIPVFNQTEQMSSLKDIISNNFITLFSLDMTTLGEKVTKTISGFIMQQLLTLIQNMTIKEHIIFIIDEVPVIENNILCRFLSESRKYNLSLILASQYFNQISSSLKDAIFANVINYYIFRVSRSDASLLVNHLDIKIPSISDKSIEEQKEEKINILSNLNNRECFVRISSNKLLTPCFKAHTLDFYPLPPKEKKEYQKIDIIKSKKNSSNLLNFNINNTSLKDLLKQTSSSRMVMK